MAMLLGDYLWSRLKEWGVKRVFGYPGDGINGLMGALHRADKEFDYVRVRHEEMAAFMACAHAKFTGEVGVCIATSGPGAIHLLNGLYDAKMDHVPVLAIVGQQARSALTRNQARILGVVLNKRAVGEVRTGFGYGSLTPNEAGLGRSRQYNQFERLQLYSMIQRPPPVKFRDLEAIVERGHAGNALQEDMAAGKESDQKLQGHVIHAHDHAADRVHTLPESADRNWSGAHAQVLRHARINCEISRMTPGRPGPRRLLKSHF